ncbi:MAG: amino acid permease [Alphaproteobacteria bacterium]|nr:amino acid permease [Alphaproteobacteria bacterium]
MSDNRTGAQAIAREAGLHQGLTQRQVVMIGLGGAIGTGLFMGSAIAIGYAGPAVLLSYVVAGFIALTMVFSLSEMAVVHPTAGSFGTYAETYIGPWAGFIVRYTYWFAQVIAIGGEAVAAGIYMTYWFPDVPVWLWALAFSAVLIAVNSRSVANFGSIEYWFALIKVVAIVLFIVLGLSQIAGLGGPAIGFRNLTGLPGGFLPNGIRGMWMGVIMGIFSFIGVEVIAITSAEVPNPQVAIPRALRTMGLRLFLFYILALGIVVAIAPWTETGARIVQQSPFVRVFAHSGIAFAAGIMNFVVISAALSSMNTNIYCSTRMLFSLSRGNYAPKFLGALNATGTPTAAALFSGAFILGSAAVSIFTPLAYNYLQGIALFGAILVWMTILASHLRFRRAHKAATLPVRMPFFPIVQILGFVLLGAILVTMGLDKDWNVSWIVGVPFVALLSVAYFMRRKR